MLCQIAFLPQIHISFIWTLSWLGFFLCSSNIIPLCPLHKWPQYSCDFISQTFCIYCVEYGQEIQWFSRQKTLKVPLCCHIVLARVCLFHSISISCPLQWITLSSLQFRKYQKHFKTVKRISGFCVSLLGQVINHFFQSHCILNYC